jgi:hypothetical protein
MAIPVESPFEIPMCAPLVIVDSLGGNLRYGVLGIQLPAAPHRNCARHAQCGRLCFARRKIKLSTAVAGEDVSVREAAEHVWLISYMHYHLGCFDDQCDRVECAPNPFGAKVLPMVCGIIRYPCDRNGP